MSTRSTYRPVVAPLFLVCIDSKTGRATRYARVQLVSGQRPVMRPTHDYTPEGWVAGKTTYETRGVEEYRQEGPPS